MGKKRAKKGKYLFLYSTCFLAILLLSIGCVTTLKFQKRWQGHEHLKVAEKLITKGNYEGGLKEYGEVLRLCPKVSPGDSALFHVGLIWAHPDNLQMDYKKSLTYFQQLVRDFPQSASRERARVWVYAISELIRSESKLKDLEKSVDYLKSRLKENDEKINALKKQLKKIKEIDIGIEEKKRERLPRNKQVKGNGR